jgi:ssDNA-binding Zn-finger/Zn-ribbon topoisomerase 1
MEDRENNNKCKECGELLKASQYARIKREGEPAVKETEDLVCRNYPKCPKAEKDFE